MTSRHAACGLTALAIALLLPVARAGADVAATGSFDVSLTPVPPGNVSFDGDITFDAGARSVLGKSVDMATAVGDMTFEGDGVVDVANESAAFGLTAESEGDFDFEASGTASCENAGCLNGRGSFGGRLTAVTDPGGVLPQGVFTFDGTASISAVGVGVDGVFAINAFAPIATTTGTDVEVTSGPTAFLDTVANEERTFTASARFASVTGAGNTEFVAFSTFPSEFPAGISVNRNVSVFVDIQTTATVTGTVQVCVAYPDANDDDIVDGTPNDLNASRLRLLHAATIDSPFSDRTTSFGSGRVCGNVPAVGPVALGVGASGSTTTTVAGASTSTTSLEPGATTTTSSTVVGETSTTSSTLVGETTTTTLVGETTTTSTTLPTGESSTTSTTLLSGASTTTSSTLPGGTTTSTTTPPGGASTTTTVATGRSSTTSTTVPLCVTAIDCLDLAIAGPLCPGETINPRLSTLILKKLTKAQTALLAARVTGSGKKLARLVIKARKQMDKVGRKADAFASKPKGAISVECRDRIRAALILVTQQIAASRI